VHFLSYALIAVASYLLGSIPTGFLVARVKGIDIRKVGSGNIGATNALRVLGKPAGILVLLVDALKGLLAVAIVVNWYPELHEMAPRLFGVNGYPDSQMREVLGIVAGVFAVLGHNYPCWLGFKGGKGIATSAGVLTALVPWALLIILSVWIVLCAATRYVSIGSLAASATLPFATWLTTRNWTLTVVTGAMGVLAIYKHKGNIQRLMNGTEPRFGRKKPVSKVGPAWSEQANDQADSSATPEEATPPDVRAALVVIGLPEGSAFEGIRKAYYDIVKQYHPDMVAHLGPELKKVAELKTKEINHAYQVLENFYKEEAAQ